MAEPIKLTMKAARVNANMTQEEAGKAIGVSKDVISNWERGVSYPNVMELRRIEQAYQVTYNDLIFLPK